MKKSNSTYLSASEIAMILESLRYTKKKFEEYPIGPEGYPNLDFKKKRIDEVAGLIEKVKSLSAS